MKVSLRGSLGLAGVAATLVLSACGGGNNGDISISGTATGVTADVTLANVVNTVVMPITVPANATTFAFPKRVRTGSAFAIYLQTVPVNLNCGLSNAAGYAPSYDVTTVQLVCQPRNLLGGTVSGLTGTGLALANGSDTVSVAANATTFNFANRVNFGSAYGVTILTQPAGQTCAVTNGSAKMGNTDVANVQVSCS